MLELVDSDGNVIARSTDTNPDVIDDIHERTGSITSASNPASPNPIVISSASHGLATGDHVFVSGVLGNTAANGPFSVTVVDPDHFILDGSHGNGVYAGGGTWTILPVDPGLSGGAISFDKDPYNGRDTYSTNIGSTRVGPAHAIASSSPPPRQNPETAATIGVRRRPIASQRSRWPER